MVDPVVPDPSFNNPANSISDTTMEWVLLVPPKLTQSTHAILLRADCLARPWHLEGRFGSRTHAVGNDDNKRMGIPVLSQARVLQKAKDSKDLQNLLSRKDVEFVWKEFVHAKRAVRTMPYVDATLHPERKPAGFCLEAVHTVEWNKHHCTSSFTYVDLFAGIGGFAVALDALGGQCVLASELEDCCQNTYQHNFPTAPLQGDIYQILATDPPPTAALDILVGGFPCQPFSSLGNQPGLACPKGNLFQEIVRLLKAWQPKAFLLENVPGLLAMEDNDTFATILNALQEAGYDVTYEVCNARGLTATSRKRLFLVGLRKESSANNITTPAFEFPFVPDLQLKASDVLDFRAAELSDMERRVLPITDEQLGVLNASKRWKPADLAWPNTVCDTLVSHYGNSITRGSSQLVPCAGGTGVQENTDTMNTNPRRFSPRECLRIMGFPNSYRLLDRKEGSKQGDMAYCKEQYRMIGNAVCPPLIAALAGAVLDRVLTRKPPCGTSNWVEWGRYVAVGIAYQATKKGRPVSNTNAIEHHEETQTRKKGTKRDFVAVS